MSDPVPFDTAPLRSARRAAYWTIVWERLWPRLLPLLGIISAFLALSWFGVWPMVQDGVRQALLLALELAGLVALWPLAGLRPPSPDEVDRRIEARSDLIHQPVSSQQDRIAGDADPFAAALWREHRARLASGLTNLRTGTPEPAIAARDPFGLRALPVLVLFIAAAAGYGEWGTRIGDAFRSHAGQQAVAAGRIDAWITPPAYTNRPPMVLDLAAATNPEAPLSLTVPEGSQFVLRAQDLDAPGLTFEGADLPQDDESTGQTTSYAATLESAGTIALTAAGAPVAAFAIDIVPDDAPTIELTEQPKGSNRSALEFAYGVSDDYGVTGAQATITAPDAAASGAEPLVEAPTIDLPLPRSRAKEGTAKTSRDLSAHPWAGGEVELTLTATDDAGQEGSSAPVRFVLPERIFVKPLARALVFERRRLALDKRERDGVADMLTIITTTHPDELIPNVSHYMALRVITRMVSRNEDEATLRDALDVMWETALAIEDGDLSAAERRLRDAQERLSEALEDGATDEEIEKLMDELRQAMAEFMREMAEQMAKNPNQQAMQNPQDQQQLSTRDLDEMMQRIEDLAKSGSRDAARELLQEMQRMMDNLQMAQPGQQQQQQNPMSEQMNELGEMMQDQQRLMDETFDAQRRQQQQQQQGQQGEQQQGEQGQQQGEQGQQPGQEPMTAEEFAEAMKQLQQQQGELQERMQALQDALEGMGMEPGEQLGEAGEAMGGAEGELGKGQAGPATGEQGRALQAMREGAQQMMQQMQQQAQGQGQGEGQGQPGGQPRDGRDPLGRQSRSEGPQLGDDVKVPGEIDAQRAREILDAIRERLGETTRPALELDYLDRLLPGR